MVRRWFPGALGLVLIVAAAALARGGAAAPSVVDVEAGRDI